MKDDMDHFLLISGFNIDKSLLTNQDLLHEVLEELPKTIDMKLIGNVSIIENNRGLNGYIPIDESNITINTIINKSKIIAKIHSCKEFDYEKVLKYLKIKYNCSKVKFLYHKESDFKDVN